MLKHSKDGSDDSGMVDNALRNDGKEGLKGHIVPRTGQVVCRFPLSLYPHSLPLCPGLSEHRASAPREKPRKVLMAVSTKLLISLRKDQAHQASTILSEADDSQSQERKRRWLISLPCIQLEGDLFVLRGRAESPGSLYLVENKRRSSVLRRGGSLGRRGPLG